jgi:hypothetical protein
MNTLIRERQVRFMSFIFVETLIQNLPWVVFFQ